MWRCFCTPFKAASDLCLVFSSTTTTSSQDRAWRQRIGRGPAGCSRTQELQPPPKGPNTGAGADSTLNSASLERRFALSSYPPCLASIVAWHRNCSQKRGPHCRQSRCLRLAFGWGSGQPRWPRKLSKQSAAALPVAPAAPASISGPTWCRRATASIRAAAA